LGDPQALALDLDIRSDPSLWFHSRHGREQSQ
jgi:hypothetical protein